MNIFVNIGHNLANKIKMQPNSYEIYLGGTFQESMFLSPVTKEEINSIISTFGGTASGWDDIAPRSIKFVREIIQKPLICNISFYMGIVPEQIKIARVVPIFKHGDPFQFNNYRPVSVLNGFFLKSMRDYFIIVFWNISSNIRYCMNCNLGFGKNTFNQTCTYLPNWEDNISNWKEWIHCSSISRFVQSLRYGRSSDIIEEIRALWYKGCATKMVI